MIPFFLLRVRKGEDYLIFNPLDNREYVLNFTGYSILEHCDGVHTVDEIAGEIVRVFGLASNEAMDYVSEFLKEMSGIGAISWRQDKLDPKRNWAPPSTVFWDITGECNLKCVHCYNLNGKAHNNELLTEEVKLALEEMSAFGVKTISFSGGEPLLRKDFLDILHHAACLSFSSVTVSTNGTLIDRDIAAQLKASQQRASNLHVQISIDGDTADIHDRMRGMKGAFEMAIRGIKILLEEGINTNVCTTATKWNVDRVPNIIRLMQEFGVESYRVQGVMPMGRGRVNEENIKLTPSRMKELVEYLEHRKIQISSYNFTLKDPPAESVDFCSSGACSAATASCSITAEGNVVPCTYFWGINGDNLRYHTFPWIWEKSAVLNYFRTIRLNEIKGLCKECRWLSVCHGGCKAENYVNGDVFESSRSCWVADEMRQITC